MHNIAILFRPFSVDFVTPQRTCPPPPPSSLQVYYTAPEVWAERYDHKCDVFSCGVLLYVLLCLYTPFDGDDDNDILRKVCGSLNVNREMGIRWRGD